MIEQPASPVLAPVVEPSRSVLGPAMRAILDAVPDGITVQDASGRVVYANDAAARLAGFDHADEFLTAPPAELMSRFEILDEAGRPFPLEALPGRLVLRGYAPAAVTIQFRLAGSRETRWSILRSTPLHGPDGAITHAVNAFQDITARILVERELRASEARFRLVAEAAEDLDESLDLDETVQATAAIAVPRLADWCVIDLLEDDGTVRRAAIRVGDAAYAAIGEQLRDYPSVPGSDGLMGRSLVDGVTRRYDVDRVDLRRITKDERHARVLTELEARSAIVVPLVARGRVLGAIALVRGWSGRTFTDEDLPVAEDLGRRAALAIGNAALFRAEGEARRAAEAAAVRTHRLQRLTRALADARSKSDVASVVVRHARAAFGAAGGAVFAPDASGEDREVLAFGGQWDARGSRTHRGDTGWATRVARVTETGVDEWAIEPEDVTAARDGDAAAAKPAADRATTVLPMIAKGRHIGVLALSWRERRDFTPEERDLGRAIADLAAQALERATLAEARLALLADLEGQRGRLTAVIEQMPEGVIIAEAPTGRLVLGNAQVDRIWRHPFVAAASIGEYRHYRGFHADGTPLAPEEWPLARAIQGEVVENAEIDFQRGDGTMGTMLASAAPIQDPTGRIVAAVVTFTDITGRRRAQERERYLAEASQLLGSSLEYEETLRRVAELAVPRIADWCAVDLVDEDALPTRLVVAHVDPAKVELARELREHYPFDPDAPAGVAAVLRTGRSELITDVAPDVIDNAAVSDEHREILRTLQLRSYMCVPLLAGGRILGALTFVGAESGRRYTEEDLAFAEALAARASAAIENARLYRERVDAESRLERLAAAEHARAAELDAVIDAMGEAIFVCDSPGRVRLANPAARLLGDGPGPATYDEVLALLGASDVDLPPLGVRAGPVEVPAAHGEDRWLELSTYPVASPEGRHEGDPPETIVVLRDVTDARRMQAVRDTFVGVLSHELRTPITTIYGGAMILARNGLDAERRQAVFDDIASEASRLHRLVEDVIALNRFGEADGDVGHEPVLIQRVLPSVIRAEETRWPRVTFVLKSRPGLPTVEADRTYVEQVVRNLLSNAAKYGGAGTTVEVHTDADAEEVRVRILDDGPGFPAEEAERLFEIFFRSPSTASAAGGAGIGLFVCARLIRAMGGRIWAQPRPEGGAEFGFALRVMTED